MCSTFRIPLRDVVKRLGISGDVRSCGLNLRMKVVDGLDRELVIVVRRKLRK